MPSTDGKSGDTKSKSSPPPPAPPKTKGGDAEPPGPLMITVITGSNAETTTIKGGAALNSPTRVAAAIADGRSLGVASGATIALGRIRWFRWSCVLCMASALVMTVAGVLTWFDATTTSAATSLVTPVQCYSLPTFGIVIALLMGAGIWLPTQRKAFLMLAWILASGCFLIPMIVMTAAYGFRPDYYDDTVRVDAADRYDSDESIRTKYATAKDFGDACVRSAFILTCCAAITGALLVLCMAAGWYVRIAFVAYEKRLIVKQQNAPVPAATAAIVVRAKAASTAPQPHKWVWAAPSANADATSNAWAVFKPKPLNTTDGAAPSDVAGSGPAVKSPTNATAGLPNNIAISSGAGSATLGGAAPPATKSPPPANPITLTPTIAIIPTAVITAAAAGEPAATAVPTKSTKSTASAAVSGPPKNLSRAKTTDVSKTPPASSSHRHHHTTNTTANTGAAAAPVTTHIVHHHHYHVHRKKQTAPKPKVATAAATAAGSGADTAVDATEKVEELTATDLSETDSVSPEAPVVDSSETTLITRSARYRGEKTLGFVSSADEFSPPPPALAPTTSDALPHAVTPSFLLDSKPPLLSAAAASGTQTEKHKKKQHKQHHHHKPNPPPPVSSAAAAADGFESVLPPA